MKTLLTAADPLTLSLVFLGICALLIISSLVVAKKMPTEKNIAGSLVVLSAIPLLIAAMFMGAYESAAAGIHISHSADLASKLFTIVASLVLICIAAIVSLEKKLTQ